MISGRRILMFSFPFLPPITGGFILALCNINLFRFLFFLLLPEFYISLTDII